MGFSVSSPRFSGIQVLGVEQQPNISAKITRIRLDGEDTRLSPVAALKNQAECEFEVLEVVSGKWYARNNSQQEWIPLKTAEISPLVARLPGNLYIPGAYPSQKPVATGRISSAPKQSSGHASTSQSGNKLWVGLGAAAVAGVVIVSRLFSGGKK